MKHYLYALLLTVVVVPFAYAAPETDAGFVDTQAALNITDLIFRNLFDAAEKNPSMPFNSLFGSMEPLTNFTKNMNAFIADKEKVLGITDKTIHNAYNKLKTGLIQLPQLIENIKTSIDSGTISRQYKQFDTSLNTIARSIDPIIGSKELQKIANNHAIILTRKKSAVQVIDKLARKLQSAIQSVKNALGFAVN